jgi:RNA polymerase sigma-70 factor, ECF subfamily
MDEDVKLIESFRSGSRDAFDRLLEKYRGSVYGLALRLTGNSEDAEEIAQQTFINALTHLNSFRGDSSFRTWLYRITVNESRTHSRRRRHVVPIEDMQIASPDLNGPETSAVTHDETLRMFQRLRQLPEKQRLAVLLHAVQELDYEETGRIIGCSAATAKVNYHYGVESLRKKMKES